MDEKTMQRMKKIQTLAERGVGGERDTAEKMLQKMLKKNGIRSLDELQSAQYEYVLFPYNGKYEKKLLKQCIYKALTAAGDRTYYHTKGKRQKLGIYCTKAQKIFPPDAPIDSSDSLSERDMKILHMAGGIKKRIRTAMINCSADKE